MAKLHEILGTKNSKEQAQRAEQLLKLASAPVIDVVVRADTRTGQIALSVIGGEVQATQIHQILDGAQAYLRELELAAAKQSSDVESSEEIQEPEAE